MGRVSVVGPAPELVAGAIATLFRNDLQRMIGAGLPLKTCRRGVLQAVHDDLEAANVSGYGDELGLNSVHVVHSVDIAERKRLPLADGDTRRNRLNTGAAARLGIRELSIVHDGGEIIGTEVRLVVEMAIKIP